MTKNKLLNCNEISILLIRSYHKGNYFSTLSSKYWVNREDVSLEKIKNKSKKCQSCSISTQWHRLLNID